MAKTTTKRPTKPFKGDEGVKFSSENQPSPEAKKAGWEQWRKERHLTQTVIKQLNKGNSLTEYVKSMVTLAKRGNPKAIDVITKCLEDDIIKIASTNSDGEDIPPLPNTDLKTLLTEINKANGVS